MHVLPDILDTCDTCFLQEHWLLEDQLHILNDVNHDFTSVGISGMDSWSLLPGRPYGGCGILYRKSLLPLVKVINTHSKQFCAIELSGSTDSFLIICVYFPSDCAVSSSSDYLNTLGELEGFFETQSPDCNILIVGDFNVDFSRHGHSVQLLQNFMRDNFLVVADLRFQGEINFTYERDDGCVHSWIDHIMCSESCLNSITNVSRLDLAVNLSDHYPLEFYFEVLCALPPVSSPPFMLHHTNVPKFDWASASPSDLNKFRDLVENSLPKLPDAASACCEPTCDVHQSSLDEFCSQLSASLLDSAIVLHSFVS